MFTLPLILQGIYPHGSLHLSVSQWAPFSSDSHWYQSGVTLLKFFTGVSKRKIHPTEFSQTLLAFLELRNRKFRLLEQGGNCEIVADTGISCKLCIWTYLKIWGVRTQTSGGAPNLNLIWGTLFQWLFWIDFCGSLFTFSGPLPECGIWYNTLYLPK